MEIDTFLGLEIHTYISVFHRFRAGERGGTASQEVYLASREPPELTYFCKRRDPPSRFFQIYVSGFGSIDAAGAAFVVWGEGGKAGISL